MIINTSSTQKTNQIIQARKVINGKSEGMLQLLPYKYQFAEGFFESMYSNSWHPAEVNLNEDSSQWKNVGGLSPQEKEVFARSLSFISNLDTVQTSSLVHAISRQITAPEIQLLIIRQAFEETIHVLAYNRMIELLGLDPEETYGRYRHDQELKSKLDHICSSINQIMVDDFKTGTPENDQIYLEALVNNILLEGLFFYSSFLMFYSLARTGKMLNSARMIGLINRDEATHRTLVMHILNLIVAENPSLWTTEFQQKMVDKIKKAVELEIAWGCSIIGYGILGINRENLTKYIQFLGDIILTGINLPTQYHNTNPFPWVDNYTQINQELGAFFETSVARYSQEVPQFEEAEMLW
jgi:ribonucleoside-diphosphate reductase beta chain